MILSLWTKKKKERKNLVKASEMKAILTIVFWVDQKRGRKITQSRLWVT